MNLRRLRNSYNIWQTLERQIAKDKPEKMNAGECVCVCCLRINHRVSRQF